MGSCCESHQVGEEETSDALLKKEAEKKNHQAQELSNTVEVTKTKHEGGKVTEEKSSNSKINEEKSRSGKMTEERSRSYMTTEENKENNGRSMGSEGRKKSAIKDMNTAKEDKCTKSNLTKTVSEMSVDNDLKSRLDKTKTTSSGNNFFLGNTMLKTVTLVVEFR
uniref:Uncharacterized protein n=1 Tax=Heterorhabditis bacteriophora TaxID=37862 RepID=A0A1I7W6E1_HETBA